MLKYKKGDKVIISKYYKNSFDSSSMYITLDDDKLVQIDNVLDSNANHPYLVKVKHNIIGWCDDDCIIGIDGEYIKDTIKIYEHYIKKGETLISIANLYNTTYNQIANDNNITNINKLKIGDKLIIKV